MHAARPPPALGARPETGASAAEAVADAPIYRLPPELVALVLQHLPRDDGGVSVCMCLLASPLFHVIDPSAAWQHGEWLRAHSIDADRLASRSPPYLCKRLLRCGALTECALKEAITAGNLDVVEMLWHSGEFAGAHADALNIALDHRHWPVVRFLLTERTMEDEALQALAREAAPCADNADTMASIHQAARSPPLQSESLRTIAQKATIAALASARPSEAVAWLAARNMLCPHVANIAAAVVDLSLAYSIVDMGFDGGPAMAHRVPVCPTDPERSLRLVEHLTGEAVDGHGRVPFGMDPIVLWACRLIRMGHCEALALLVDRNREMLSAFVSTQRAYFYGSARPSNIEFLVDYVERPLDSLVMLRRLMAQGDAVGVVALCERRHALGLACDVGATYGIESFVCGTGQRETSLILRAERRAFDLDMARAAGTAAYVSFSYIQAAAVVGAADTVDWALSCGGRRLIKATVGRLFDLAVVDVLVRHDCLADRWRTLAALITSKHEAHASAIVAAYPDAVASAAEVALIAGIKKGDVSVIDRTMAICNAAPRPSAALMNYAAAHAPLNVLLAMVRHGGAQCTRRGVARSMKRPHGLVVDRLYEERETLCVPGTFDVSTRKRRRAWKRIIDATAGAGFLDNAQQMADRLGIVGLRQAAMDAAVFSDHYAVAMNLCTAGAHCSTKAFTKAVLHGNVRVIECLLRDRHNRSSTFAPVLAIQRKRPDLALLFIQGGRPVAGDALIAAAANGFRDIVEALLGRLCLRRRTLNKAQRKAADNGHTEIEALLRHHRPS